MKVFPGTHLLGRIPFEWVGDPEGYWLPQSRPEGESVPPSP